MPCKSSLNVFASTSIVIFLSKLLLGNDKFKLFGFIPSGFMVFLLVIFKRSFSLKYFFQGCVQNLSFGVDLFRLQEQKIIL